MSQLLNETQKVKLQKIWDTDYQTIVSGKDNGIPFLSYVFELHRVIFGETCSTCPYKISGYVKKLKNLKENPMEKTVCNFKLHGQTTFNVPGTGQFYSNGNLTDEAAIAFLSVNTEKRKALFVTLPENVDELIEEFKKQSEEPKEGKGVKHLNLVVIGDSKVTLEQALSIIQLAGLTTKATTVDGVQKFIGKQEGDVLVTLQGLAAEKAKEVLENIDVNTEGTEGTEGGRTQQQVEFELAAAEQALADAKEDEKEELTKKVEALKSELQNL
ncbi:hypothetical protein [Flavobacterium sp.]|uniref:hypothetical protein n=1 Tax=Flavobacterium sp. TaxID=239 RepID=UPI0022C61174|nr:hypothetical protein [Flavobacterium sp.]MCZ8144864.1 hypothetical protein [Flavobacterium sp.]